MNKNKLNYMFDSVGGAVVALLSVALVCLTPIMDGGAMVLIFGVCTMVFGVYFYIRGIDGMIKAHVLDAKEQNND